MPSRSPALAALAPWLLASPLGDAAPWSRLGVGASLAIVGRRAGCVAARVEPACGCAGTARWTFAPGAPAREPQPGTLEVAIDLGAFLLLRFGPTAPAGGRSAGCRSQRRGLERAWHALRCAVYSPRPVAGAAAPRRAAIPDRMNAPDADALLVERVKQGDVEAFEMLVVKYQRRIERLIGRMVRDVDLVPDIAQETFIRAYRALPQFRGDSAFYTWLYRIAVNTAKKALVELKRDPLVTESARAGRDEDDETSRVENELSDGETPGGGAGEQGNRGRGERCDRSAVRRSAPGDHAARDRRPELRRDRRGDELPDRDGAVADLPRARSDRGAAAAAARTRAKASAGESAAE